MAMVLGRLSNLICQILGKSSNAYRQFRQVNSKWDLLLTEGEEAAVCPISEENRVHQVARRILAPLAHPTLDEILQRFSLGNSLGLDT